MPARISCGDAQVRLAFFQTLKVGRSDSRQIFQPLEKVAAEGNHELVSILESKECVRTVRQFSRFLRIELPKLEHKTDGGPEFARIIRKTAEVA